MAELPSYAEQTREGALRNWILSEMLRGAGWAALVVLASGLFIYIWVIVSWALPENPNAALEVVSRTMLA